MKFTVIGLFNVTGYEDIFAEYTFGNSLRMAVTAVQCRGGQINVLNIYGWNQHWFRIRPSHPALVPDLTSALLSEWTRIPMETLGRFSCGKHSLRSGSFYSLKVWVQHINDHHFKMRCPTSSHRCAGEASSDSVYMSSDADAAFLLQHFNPHCLHVQVLVNLSEAEVAQGR